MSMTISSFVLSLRSGEKVPQVDLESLDSRATPLACLGAKSFQSRAAQLFPGSIRRCLQKISGISHNLQITRYLHLLRYVM